ncbi:hypothetical protein ASPTUDRAFT_702810 [Aspergillus tubingensis CBS 134.48]|uniref:Secreted protein n=1 Tax=Aspergillus tubingensis (strain CBS 134.48) TaxID=767770 RepID=A0A1L9N1X3_ASPTC|nr:hypothetical protein ASPTUDRAFT_702810 [Aspergillus tubingensis CBS 134.48]
MFFRRHKSFLFILIIMSSLLLPCQQTNSPLQLGRFGNSGRGLFVFASAFWSAPIDSSTSIIRSFEGRIVLKISGCCSNRSVIIVKSMKRGFCHRSVVGSGRRLIPSKTWYGFELHCTTAICSEFRPALSPGIQGC